MLDSDLASIYGVETKALNRAVKRNRNRFPKDFVFRPVKEVKTGNIFRSGRRWAMLDLLLTSKTIAEASAKSYKRVEEI